MIPFLQVICLGAEMLMRLQSEPDQLFYDFCLHDHVPADHLLRKIDHFLNFDDLRQKLKPFYCSNRRPSNDLELLLRMLIVGYCLAIRSERRLCEEVHLNLAYRWFYRLRLYGKVLDHSTFSLNRNGRFRDVPHQGLWLNFALFIFWSCELFHL